jgi:hypothetical protein
LELLKAVIDRFEGDKAVLLVGDMQDHLVVSRGIIPKDAEEGDWLSVEVDGKRILRVVIDEEETAAAKRRIEEKLAVLRRGNHLN